jgi:PleD family two-component response regulator
MPGRHHANLPGDRHEVAGEGSDRERQRRAPADTREGTGLAGSRDVTTEDGQDAWERFLSFQPDVVLSDWLMPGVDEIELCRRIRTHDADRYASFRAADRKAEVEHAVTAMTAGADDFMVKPLDRVALEATLIAGRRVTALHDELRDQRSKLERLNSLLYEWLRRADFALYRAKALGRNRVVAFEEATESA